jgi:hypothetical protein
MKEMFETGWEYMRATKSLIVATVHTEPLKGHEECDHTDCQELRKYFEGFKL